jgi:uncharacterized repeat protein (TIGR01451 family)
MKDIFMSKGIQKVLSVAALLALCVGTQAYAAEQGCIVLKSTAEVEQTVVDAKGGKTTKLVAADKVVPGVEVVWTVTANNICKQPSDKVTINNAVPAHMTYVANSATGPGADITYSLDGQNFGAAEQLSVSESGGKRKARADEYKNIRWVFKNSLQPGSQAVAQFRAVLN